MPTDFHNKKVAILGLGVNNQELVPYLQKQGAEITICDKNPEIEQQSGLHYQLGEGYLDNLTHFDIIFRTPGIPYLTEQIQAAQAAGVHLTSQTQLFLDECPAKTIGVTGTKGKGTTSSLIEACLKAAAQRQEIPGHVYLVGNIGVSPIGLLDQLTPKDWVVLELSSFQTQDLTKSPHIAVILSVTSDHLDHHKDLTEYHDAKRNLVRHQTPDDFVIVHHDNPVSMSFLDATHAQPYFYSRQQPVELGAFIDHDKGQDAVILRLDHQAEQEICLREDIKLFGDYNLENVTAATIASALAGCSAESIREGITSFEGLPHRLQFVAEKQGVRYFNDSFSTNPTATSAALSAFKEPIVLIVGGGSKDLDYQELAETISKSSTKTVIYIGEEGPKIKDLLQKKAALQTLIDGATTMREIVGQARAAATEGDVVLLSPAATSFGLFKDYKDRGKQFIEAVENLP